MLQAIYQAILKHVSERYPDTHIRSSEDIVQDSSKSVIIIDDDKTCQTVWVSVDPAATTVVITATDKHDMGRRIALIDLQKSDSILELEEILDTTLQRQDCHTHWIENAKLFYAALKEFYPQAVLTHRLGFSHIRIFDPLDSQDDMDERTIYMSFHADSISLVDEHTGQCWPDTNKLISISDPNAIQQAVKWLADAKLNISHFNVAAP